MRIHRQLRWLPNRVSPSRCRDGHRSCAAVPSSQHGGLFEWRTPWATVSRFPGALEAEERKALDAPGTVEAWRSRLRLDSQQPDGRIDVLANEMVAMVCRSLR